MRAREATVADSGAGGIRAPLPFSWSHDLRVPGPDDKPGIVGRLRSSDRIGSRLVLVPITLGVVLAATALTAEAVARQVEATATAEATSNA